MIKVEGACVTLNGPANEIVTEFTLATIAILKAGVPQDAIDEAFRIAISLYETNADESEESLDILEAMKRKECEKELNGIKNLFRNMNDDAKSEIVKAMMEVMKEDD